MREKPWRLRRIEAGLGAAATAQLVDRLEAAIKQGRRPARGGEIAAQSLGCDLIEPAVSGDDDAVTPRSFRRHQPPCDVGGDFLGGSLERIAPAAAAPSVEMQHVAGLDMNAVAFARDVLDHAVLAHQLLG